MKIIYTIFLILSGAIPALAQNFIPEQEQTPKIQHEIYVGYGIMGFYTLPDAQVYTTSQSSGIVLASYMAGLGDGYAVGILGAYEYLTPVIQNSPENFYVERSLALLRLNKTLVQRNRFSLYVSALAGIKQEKKQLVFENATTLEPAYDFVLVGLAYNPIKNVKLSFEAGYSNISLFRIGVAFVR